MKIMKCNSCGEIIHESNKCFHCGNSTGFKEVKKNYVHENVEMEYARVEVCLKEKRFEEVINLSHKIVEWMPNFSEVFWIRVLAKNKCTTDFELIQKGFLYKESADFYNAMLYADESEKKVYQDVISKIEELKKEYTSKLLSGLHKEISDTHILGIRESMVEKIEKHSKKLFLLWSDLEKTEQQLYVIETDCRLITEEYKKSLENAHSSALNMENKSYQLKECTADELHTYQVQLGNVLQQSEQAKDVLDSMKKQHPKVAEFNKLVSKRDHQITQIKDELAKLRNYQQDIQAKVTAIERVEEKYKMSLRHVEQYSFNSAKNLLSGSSRNVFGVNVE